MTLFSETVTVCLLLQLDSVFNLQRPYDLVALLKQEDRARMLENLKQELLAKKEQIDGSEDKNTGGFYCLHYNENAV